jgi:predicted RNA binding protein YcfA (HicA-like mRNA interferase family)
MLTDSREIVRRLEREGWLLVSLASAIQASELAGRVAVAHPKKNIPPPPPTFIARPAGRRTDYSAARESLRISIDAIIGSTTVSRAMNSPHAHHQPRHRTPPREGRLGAGPRRRLAPCLSKSENRRRYPLPHPKKDLGQGLVWTIYKAAGWPRN